MNLRHKRITNIFTKLGKESFKIWFSGIEYEGEYKEWYDNGQIFEHSFYKNGKWDGEYKLWYENGQIMEHGFWKDMKREGEFKSWDEDGTLRTNCIFKDGEIIRDLL